MAGRTPAETRRFTGSGTLATVNVTGKQLLPIPQGAPPQALNLSGVTLHDVSGDALVPVTTTPGYVQVVGCPDFDGNRAATFTGDVIDVAKEALIRPPLHPAKYDVDRNGTVTFTGDVIISAKVVLMTQPTPLRCPPQ
jgi:hypothetical protein